MVCTGLYRVRHVDETVWCWLVARGQEVIARYRTFHEARVAAEALNRETEQK